MRLNHLIATVIGVLAIGTLSVVNADAQTVNQRLRDQHAREAQGIHSGELTRREARKVRAADRRIHRSERRDRAMHFGHLTPAERARLNHRLNRNSAKIYRKKHNSSVR